MVDSAGCGASWRAENSAPRKLFECEGGCVREQCGTATDFKMTVSLETLGVDPGTRQLSRGHSDKINWSLTAGLLKFLYTEGHIDEGLNSSDVSYYWKWGDS